MLEKSTLLLLPWTRIGDGLNTRPVVDEVHGEQLGFARTSGKIHAWSSRWRSCKLEVFETEDASHLMTLYRPAGLFRMWRVQDSEQRQVGAIYHRHLLNPLGHLMAHCDQPPSEPDGRFLCLQGEPLACWERVPDGLRIQFADNRDLSPFQRMVLLGTVLTWPCED